MSPPKKSATTKPTPKKKVPTKSRGAGLRSTGKSAGKGPASPKIPAVKSEVSAKSAEAAKKMETGVKGIRIRLSAFDHIVLDEAAGKIIETAERSGAIVHGPIPLPTKIRKFTVNRSTFKHKDARDQFEMRIHRRLIDLAETTFKTIESLQSLSLPSGVDIEIKMG
jgi:small subunit ribosomal protein S10